jgi:hypothetical protein
MSLKKTAYPCIMHTVTDHWSTYWASSPYADYEEAWAVARAWDALDREVLLRPDVEGYVLIMYSNPEMRHFRARVCQKCKARFRQSADEHLCRACGAQQGYGADSYEERYHPFTTDTVTFGFELELQETGEGYAANPYGKLLEDLIKAGFLRTADNTVSDEMKSPIYGCGFLPGNLRKLLDRACKYTQARNVGTHVHIGNLTPFNSFNGRYLPLGLLSERAETIWGPLERYLVHHQVSTVRVWGRYFAKHCAFPMTETHNSWVSLRDATIEWRLPKLRTYQQFARIVRYLVRVGSMLQDALRDSAPYSALDGIGERMLQAYIQTFHLEHDEPSGDIAKAIAVSLTVPRRTRPLTNSLLGTEFDADGNDEEDDEEEDD